MTTNGCCEHHDELKELLVRIDERTKHTDDRLRTFLDAQEKRNKDIDSDVKQKVSWRTFSLVVLLVSSIIAAIYLNVREIEAKVHSFAEQVTECDFSQGEGF